MARSRVFLDISVGTEPLGRLTIELFNDKAPKTCENFRSICTGSQPSLSYKGAPFHRIIDEFMCQGGDITKGDGTGGTSIYGDEFEDENLQWRDLDAAGLVCMANRGPHTNSSQFFITLAACEHLNGRHTVFGQLVSGQETLEQMAQVKVDKNDRPLIDVLISHCGELERKKKRPTATPTHSSTKIRSSEHEGKHSSHSHRPKHISADSLDDRGRHKRRRSTSRNDDAVASDPSSSEDDQNTNNGTLRQPPPHKKRSRRRSDHLVDGTRRGRTRHRASRSPPPIVEEDMDSSSSQDSSEDERSARRRNPSPSRPPRHQVEESPRFRRRRSLPNQYERLKNSRPPRNYNEEHRLREEEMDRDEIQGRYDGAQGEYGMENSSGSAGQVKFKGRGSMKYRENGGFRY